MNACSSKGFADKKCFIVCLNSLNIVHVIETWSNILIDFLIVSWLSLCIVSGIVIILSILLLVSKDAQLSCRKGDKFFGSGFYYSGMLNFHNIGDFLYIKWEQIFLSCWLAHALSYLFSTVITTVFVWYCELFSGFQVVQEKTWWQSTDASFDSVWKERKGACLI